ncbi:MAG: type II toxin-antitoxin system prevent-host-death family antitoxin [Chloroflexi bacterium]|nr:type II toxin-antitoxin system prevent-host-death family antitoxin [Chloroflexota bacterium]
MQPGDVTFPGMRTVGVRALKNRLSEYLRMVQNGESLAVTKRGVLVARLVPPDVRSETFEEVLQRKARAGEIRLGKRNQPHRYPPPPGRLSEEAILRALDWTRGER